MSDEDVNFTQILMLEKLEEMDERAEARELAEKKEHKRKVALTIGGAIAGMGLIAGTFYFIKTKFSESSVGRFLGFLTGTSTNGGTDIDGDGNPDVPIGNTAARALISPIWGLVSWIKSKTSSVDSEQLEPTTIMQDIITKD